MDKSNVMVEFRIIGDEYNLDEISQGLNINPTQCWNIGDYIRNTGRFREYTCWSYSTGYEETLDIGTQINKILGCFGEKKKY